MKKIAGLAGVVAFVVLAVWAVSAVAAAKGEKITVKGEPVDLWCYMAQGARGADHKACATGCVNAGLPIGIVDEKGNVYLAMGAKDMQNAKELLATRMADTVEVTGTLVNKGGMKTIFIESVK
jgi:hypothetical protein